jgi:hypothetical protein
MRLDILVDRLARLKPGTKKADLEKMKIKRNVTMIVMATMVATGALYSEAAAQAPPAPAEEQPEVLTRGPVNEAFAQPVNLENQTGLTAPIAPPAAIQEVPPAERPAGEEFAWAPGYWAWDSDRNGYIWVSGCWRAVPPGMSWVPGYWTEAPGGWQWVAGFWTPVGGREIEYLPAPPELTGVDAPGAAPSIDQLWVPPCWYWNHGQYTRRLGYWIGARPDWVWVPSHYIRTPRGYVFAAGHWDYPLGRRGILFAPVYFPRHIYERPRFSYGLNITIDMGNLEMGLFTRPQYSHYYFGDYYDSAYISFGIFPWFEFERRHTWYDPIYVYDRWRHRRVEPRWEQHERQNYDRLRNDKSLRPPRTYREMENRVNEMPASRQKDFKFAEPMAKVVSGKATVFRFEQINPKSRQQLTKHSDDVQKYAKERKNWESPGAGRKAVPSAIRQNPSAGAKETTAPEKSKKPETKAAEPEKSAPTERTRQSEPAGRTREVSITSTDRQRSAQVSSGEAEQNQPDRVNVRNSPVVGKKSGGFFRNRTPTRPAEEKKDRR